VAVSLKRKGYCKNEQGNLLVINHRRKNKVRRRQRKRGTGKVVRGLHGRNCPNPSETAVLSYQKGEEDCWAVRKPPSLSSLGEEEKVSGKGNRLQENSATR